MINKILKVERITSKSQRINSPPEDAFEVNIGDVLTSKKFELKR